MGAVRDRPQSCLRVGSFWAISGALVTAVCRQLGDAFEHVELHELSSVDGLLDAVERRRLDFAFATLPLRDGPFECLPLLRDPYTVVVRRSERIAAGATVTLEELSRLPVLTLEGCGAQSALELALRSRGRPLEVRKRFDTVAAVLAFVADGFGVGLLPSLSLELPKGLTALQLDPRVPQRVVALAWHRDDPLDALGQQLVDAAVAVARTFERPTLQAAS
jgi:DNA-binding transcriptional LysR family regulator